SQGSWCLSWSGSFYVQRFLSGPYWSSIDLVAWGFIMEALSLETWIRPGTTGADDSESSLDVVGSNKSAWFRVRFAIFGRMELGGQMVKNRVLV
ncbi:13052_t:CDS:2, partial [Gigaspora margarita]